jgi:hypothetical protein
MSHSIPTLTPGLKVAIIGSNQIDIASQLRLNPKPLAQSDAAIFIVSAISGISDTEIQSWQVARELYIPSIIIITDFESGEIDFDDMAMIASRILDPLVTPYLVLHDDAGAPIALISLESLNLYDYTSGSRELKASDSEHKELVREFSEEYSHKIMEFGPSGFQDGLIFPAIPYSPKIQMGLIETLEYLAKLPVRS